MVQRDVAFLLSVVFHQGKIDDPNQSVSFFRDQAEFFAQMEPQIAQRVVHDLGRIGGEQHHVAHLGLGNPFDFLLLGRR